MWKILDDVLMYMQKRAVSADYTIGGQTYKTSIRRSLIEGNKLRVHIYLTQRDPYGTVTRARLLDADGAVVAERTDHQVHEPGKGLLIAFDTTLTQEVIK